MFVLALNVMFNTLYSGLASFITALSLLSGGRYSRNTSHVKLTSQRRSLHLEAGTLFSLLPHLVRPHHDTTSSRSASKHLELLRVHRTCSQDISRHFPPAISLFVWRLKEERMEPWRSLALPIFKRTVRTLSPG